MSSDLWGELFRFDNYAELLVLVRNSIIAGAVLGFTGGLIGVFVMARDMTSPSALVLAMLVNTLGR